MLIDGKEMSGDRAVSLPICRRMICCFQWKTILDNVCLYGEIHHQQKRGKGGQRERQMIRFRPCRAARTSIRRNFPEECASGRHFCVLTLCDAGIYLLDEPFGALDVITRSDMQDWLRTALQRI